MHLVKIIGSDSLTGKAPSVAPHKGQCVQRRHRGEQQALCLRQKCHTWVLSKPNLNLAKPKRAFVLSSSMVPGINDTDKTPGKSLFAEGSSSGHAMPQAPGKDQGGQHYPFPSVCSWHCPADSGGSRDHLSLNSTG